MRIKNQLVKFHYQTQGKNKMAVCSINDTVVGQAKCNKHDQFDRKIGRKLAFGRALINFTDDKNERAEMWNEFFEKVKVPTKKQNRVYPAE